MIKTLLGTALLSTALAGASVAEAASGQINSFSASATTVTEGTLVNFTVDFGISTNSWTNGGSNPTEPEPAEGYQFWAINWYSYEHETLNSVWLQAEGNGFSDSPSVPPGGGYAGNWSFSVLFPTVGSFDVTVSGGWNASVETYHSNENAYRDCFNLDPGGSNELSCTSWNYVYDDGGDTYSSDGSFGGQSITIQVVPVPEPETWALLLAGVAVVAVTRRRATATA
jgi:hypothetical protein